MLLVNHGPDKCSFRPNLGLFLDKRMAVRQKINHEAFCAHLPFVLASYQVSARGKVRVLRRPQLLGAGYGNTTPHFTPSSDFAGTNAPASLCRQPTGVSSP